MDTIGGDLPQRAEFAFCKTAKYSTLFFIKNILRTMFTRPMPQCNSIIVTHNVTHLELIFNTNLKLIFTL